MNYISFYNIIKFNILIYIGIYFTHKIVGFIRVEEITWTRPDPWGPKYLSSQTESSGQGSAFILQVQLSRFFKLSF